MRTLRYNMVMAVIKYGVNTHPLTQVLMLGHQVEHFERIPNTPEYLFIVSDDIPVIQEYITAPDVIRVEEKQIKLAS